MIFFGRDINKSKLIFGLEFSKLKNQTGVGAKFNHHYLIILLGHKRLWIGYNRLKRKVRDKLYTIDGKKIHF